MKVYKIGDRYGKNNVLLIGDLGMQYLTDLSKTTSRMGLFQCNDCSEPFKTNMNSVMNRNTSRCKPCYIESMAVAYKPGDLIGPNKLVVIEDLGSIYNTNKSNVPCHMAMVTCPFCKDPYRVLTGSVNAGNNSRCIKCSNKASCTHGLTGTKIYEMYKSMRGRCYNPKDAAYRKYGDRGITICSEWLKDVHIFRNWVLTELDTLGRTESDLGKDLDQLSIDRINVDGSYTPDNCRFTTATVQSRNTQKISNVNISGYRGVIKSRNGFKAIIKLSGETIHIVNHKTRWVGAQAYDQYIKDHNLEHTKNGYTRVKVLYCTGMDDIRNIVHTHDLDYLISGLLTRILNNYETTVIESKLANLNINLDIPQLTKEVNKLVISHPYTYAVVEQCLRGSTIINLH